MKKSRKQLKVEFIAEAEELFDELMDWDQKTHKPDLTQIEEIILELRERLGKRLAEKVVMRQEQRQPAEKVYCPSCNQEMESKGPKHNRVESRIGSLAIERVYYYCPQCKQGFFPPGRAVENLGEALE